MRLMFNRSLNDTLFVVDVPPHVPHPKVIDGIKPVVNPMRPCVPGEFTRTRLTGIAVVKRCVRST